MNLLLDSGYHKSDFAQKESGSTGRSTAGTRTQCVINDYLERSAIHSNNLCPKSRVLLSNYCADRRLSWKLRKNADKRMRTDAASAQLRADDRNYVAHGGKIA